jgi:MFS family permease
MTPLPAAAAREQPYAWYVVFSLALINMVSYIERQIPTLLFAPIKKDFGLTDTEVSLLAGFAFVLFYVGFGLIVGRLADRMSRKRIIGIGVVLWSLATMTCGLASSFAQLFAARVAVGVGEATLGASATSILADYFPRGRLARALGVYSCAQYLGAGFALVVGGAAIKAVSAMTLPVLPLVGRIAPWQATFLVVGLFGSLVLVPFIFVREPVRRGVTVDEAQARRGVPLAELFAFMKLNWKTLTTHITAFSIVSTLGFGTVAWMPTYFVRVHHWAIHDIGYVYGMMFAFLGAAGVLAGPRFAEWLARFGYSDVYLRVPMISLAVTAIPAALVPLMPTAQASLAVLVVSIFLSSIPVALIIAALQAITPNQLRGQIVSIYLFVANIIGVGLGPVVVAAITDYVFHDEHAVGLAITTATLAITPPVVLLLRLGLKPFRESLSRAQAWADHA